MNNNIIYRQDAINSIKELPRWIMDPNGEFQSVDPPTVSMIDPEDAVSAIENLPPAQSKRKTGKWIITAEFEDCYYAKCNQCNTTQVFYGNKSLTNFCPDCGAKMER